MKNQILTILLGTLFFSTFVHAANEIKCSPAILHPGDKLTIKTSKAFQDFAIDLPYKFNRSTMQFLTETDPLTAIIDSKKFMKQKGIEIDVNTVTFNGKVPIFSKSGIYKFLVSTNLETDDGTPSYACKVKFIL